MLLVSVLKFYKKYISRVFETIFGRACRYTPTCSEYAITSIERFGVEKGSIIAIRRFLRCHPWGGGGWDPVPKK